VLIVIVLIFLLSLLYIIKYIQIPTIKYLDIYNILMSIIVNNNKEMNKEKCLEIRQ